MVSDAEFKLWERVPGETVFPYVHGKECEKQ